MCSIFKIFLFNDSERSCEGPCHRFSELSKYDNNFFEKYSIKGEDAKNMNMAHLIVNKLTPLEVDVDLMSTFDICEMHLQLLTYKHHTMRDIKCPIVDPKGLKCKNKGETNRSRVNFKVAGNIYLVLKQHVTVGSSLCTTHRKKFSAKEVPSEVPSNNEDLNKQVNGSGEDEQVFHGELAGDVWQPGDGAPGEDSVNAVTPGRKRACFLEANQTFPKLMKFDSESSSVRSQSQQQPESQGSTFSSSSDVTMDRALSNFIKLKSVLKEMSLSFKILL